MGSLNSCNVGHIQILIVIMLNIQDNYIHTYTETEKTFL